MTKGHTHLPIPWQRELDLRIAEEPRVQRRSAQLGDEARAAFAAAGPPAKRELAEAIAWQRRTGR